MLKKNKINCEHGFISLFPAIIISSLLIISCVGASQSFLTFLYSVTVFDEKVQSDVIARACSLRIMAKHVQDIHYVGGETILIDGNPCITY